MLTNTKGNGNDIGKSVTDLTLTVDKGPIYLSLKLGPTTTFFNVGVRKILNPKEIKDNNIVNKDGLALLNMFGIDAGLFAEVFNGDLLKPIVDTNPKYDKSAIEKLLQSGIGYGYHVIHKKTSKVESKQMDRAAMNNASRPGAVTIYYGGKTGKGKRINIEFESPVYTFSINIRDTQGNDGYPTRMMCDFKSKK